MDTMEMDLEDEASTDNNDRHQYARTGLSTNAPTSTNIAIAGPSPSQEGFAEGFGTGLKSAVLHPTLSSRSPVGAGSNTCGDPGVSKSRLPERLTWCGRNHTPQAQAASAAVSASAAGKARSRKQCGGCDCGSVIGRWGEVVPSGQSQDRANKSLSGKPCGSCGGYVGVGRESESRLQDWNKTSTTIFTTPSAPERTIKGGHTIMYDNNNKGIDKGAVPQEARLLCVAEDGDQAREARAKQRKRGREEEVSEPSTPLSSADSRLVGRRRGNDLITPMPRLSWGQSGHDSDGDGSATQTSTRPSSGSVRGGGGGRGAGGMTAMPVETRSDPSSDPVSKRRKSDQSHGDGSPLKSSVMVAARSKYRIVQHRGFPESGETVVGSADGADSPHTGALGKATATGACKRSMYSPGMSSSTTTSTNRRHDGRSSDLTNSSSSSYRRRYRDEYSKNKPRRRQSAAPSLLHKGSPEATGRCGAPRTPTVTVAAEAGDCTAVDPAIPILVVIDGSNVAFSFRQDVSKPKWSPQGILLAVKFFEERGVPVVAFVPRPRVDSIAPGSEHYDAFMHAMRSQAIATVPSKANDDLFILLYAIQRSAHIVSNDQFRDHLANASTLDSLGLTKDQLRTFLVDHHVSYTFARDEFVANPEAAIIRMLTKQMLTKQTAGVGSEVRRTGACTT